MKMRHSIFCVVLLCLVSLPTGAETRPLVTASEAMALKEFSLGPVGYERVTGEGELLFRTLVTQPNNLEQFVHLYSLGNYEAKAYAMVAFYYLDPVLYRHLKSRHHGTGTIVQRYACCEKYPQSFDDILGEIEKGVFREYLPPDLLDPSPRTASGAIRFKTHE